MPAEVYPGPVQSGTGIQDLATSLDSGSRPPGGLGRNDKRNLRDTTLARWRASAGWGGAPPVADRVAERSRVRRPGSEGGRSGSDAAADDGPGQERNQRRRHDQHGAPPVPVKPCSSAGEAAWRVRKGGARMASPIESA